VIRRLVFGAKKNNFHCEERAECTLFLSESTRLTRNEKLNVLSNVKDLAVGGNESRIFQTAPDSCHFGNESTTVTFFKSLSKYAIAKRDTNLRKNVCSPIIKKYVFFMKKYMNRTILMEKWLRINMVKKNKIHAFYYSLLYVRVHNSRVPTVRDKSKPITERFLKTFVKYLIFINFLLYIVTFKNI